MMFKVFTEFLCTMGRHDWTEWKTYIHLNDMGNNFPHRTRACTRCWVAEYEGKKPGLDELCFFENKLRVHEDEMKPGFSFLPINQSNLHHCKRCNSVRDMHHHDPAGRITIKTLGLNEWHNGPPVAPVQPPASAYARCPNYHQCTGFIFPIGPVAMAQLRCDKCHTKWVDVNADDIHGPAKYQRQYEECPWCAKHTLEALYQFNASVGKCRLCKQISHFKDEEYGWSRINPDGTPAPELVSATIIEVPKPSIIKAKREIRI